MRPSYFSMNFAMIIFLISDSIFHYILLNFSYFSHNSRSLSFWSLDRPGLPNLQNTFFGIVSKLFLNLYEK